MMTFKIGAATYTVRRRQSLVNPINDEYVDGYCASTVRGIFLDGNLPDNALEITLRHEYAHAWQFEFCSPKSFEEVAQFSAAVGQAFDQEFSAQGGLDALKRLPIEEAAKQATGRAAAKGIV